jgi:hypothetical protein
MKSKKTIETYNTLCEKLRNNSKVYYSRFGDGDIFIMKGKGEMMHTYSPELQKELKESILINDKNYLVGVAVNYEKEEGMYQGVFEPFGYNNELSDYLKNELKFTEDTMFESAIAFHYLSVFKQEKVIDFLNEFIRPKKKMFVGSIEKSAIEKLIGPVDYYVRIDSRNAYYSIDNWYNEVLENIDNCDVLIPAAGMATRVLNKRLWNLNKNIHSIDIGSVVDAVDDKLTRTWIRKEGNKIKNLLIK